jgi:hypothetical protein
MHRAWLGGVAACVVTSTIVAAAQIGGKPVSGGNPTPGTEQPAPPNLADRITLSGCVRAAPASTANTGKIDPNQPTDTRFVLANVTRVDRVPPGTGGSPIAAAASAATYRLEGIDSQFSPFVDTKVEISGEIRLRQGDGGQVTARESNSSTVGAPPTLMVEFVQKIAQTCK